MFELFNSVDSVYNIASQVIPDIKVVETQGSPTGVSCQIKDNVPTIMWDVDFWDYIEQNVFLRDTLPYDGEDDTKIITEYFYNYHGIQAYHLSKRYAAFPQIRAAFIEYANKYNYSYFKELYPKAVEVSEFRYDCELEVMAFKLMALYHELAHLLFRRDPDMKDNFEDMVISNVKEYIARFGDLLFSSVSDSDYIPERVTGDYLKYISNQFVDRNEKYVNLIEEMAADTYAVSKTHATIFRNAESSNYSGASDAVLSGISIFYSQISNYETVCSFWDTIIPQVILNSNNVPYGIDNILKHNEDSTLIRTFLFPPILFESVNLLDGDLWSKEDHSKFNKRLINILRKQGINDQWRWRAFESINNVEVYKKILCSANQIDITKHKYELVDLPENALLITWISNQYHNGKGRRLQEEDKQYEALQEFTTTVLITEKYLGHYHRLTARAYNNVVAALLALFEKSPTEKSILNEAKFYSDISLSILEEKKLLDDEHSAEMHQNAGIIAQWTGNYNRAIEQFAIAKEIKLRAYEGDYSYSIALTDSSIAAANYCIGNITEANKLSEKVLRFLRENKMEDDKLFRNTQWLYNKYHSI